MNAVVERSNPDEGGGSANRQLGESARAPISSASALDPALRLEQSRAKLRAAMMQIAHPAPTAASRFASTAVASAVEGLRSIPGATPLIGAVEAWWSTTPLRDAAYFTTAASRSMVMPIANRSPLKLIFGALLFGALLVALKPWRWLLRASLLAGLAPRVLKLLVRQLPLSTLMRIFFRHTLDRKTKPRLAKVPPQSAAMRDL